MTALAQRLLRILRRPILPSTPSSSTEPSKRSVETPEHRSALRTLAGVLRLYGEQSIALEGSDAAHSAAQFRGWAEHVLAGTAGPGMGPSEAGSSRDWEAVHGAFARHRTDEKANVERALAGLRETVFSVLQRLGRSVGDGRSADESVQTQLVRLKRMTAAGGSVDELRREVLSTVDTIGQVLQQSRARQAQLLETLSAELRVLRDELQHARAKMETDGLTLVYNRAALDGHLSRLCSIAGLSGDPACLLMVDVDHFKRINDSFGHPAGDEVLRRLADTIVRTFPRRTDFVARYGGEEFAVVLPQDGAETARILGARLLVNVRNHPIEIGGTAVRFSVSIGFAVLRPGEEPASWVARADHALYRAKQAGRDRLIEG